MNKNKICKKIRKLLNSINKIETNKTFLVTLKFPNPSICPETADALISKFLDNFRKQFPNVMILVLMAFGKCVGIHYHCLFLNYGNDFAKTDFVRPLRINSFKNKESIWKREKVVGPCLERKIRLYWNALMEKYAKGAFDKNESVDVRRACLDNECLINYLSREEERLLPSEWVNKKFDWIKVRNRKRTGNRIKHASNCVAFHDFLDGHGPWLNGVGNGAGLMESSSKEDRIAV